MTQVECICNTHGKINAVNLTVAGLYGCEVCFRYATGMNYKINHSYIAGIPQLLTHGLSVKLSPARVVIVVTAPVD